MGRTRFPKIPRRAGLGAQVTSGPAGAREGRRGAEETLVRIRAAWCHLPEVGGGGRGDTAGVRPPWELGSEGKPFPKERRLWPPTWSCCHHKMVLFCGAAVWVLSVRNLRAGTPGTFSTW